MDIIKINTSPSFQIVPRKKLDPLRTFRFDFINEMSKSAQSILATVLLLPNENYNITIASFPIGNVGEKLAYTLVDNLTNEVLLLGKILIMSETETTQNYSKKNNNKYYK